VISKKVISNLYVLDLTMLICILGHMNSTSVITKYFDIIIMEIIFKNSMFHLKDLCTISPAATYSALAVERVTEFYFFEDYETRQFLRDKFH